MLAPLENFMRLMLCQCPDHYFESGPRSSALRFDIDSNALKITGHEISSLADLSVKSGRYKTAHSNVEVYMLENDSYTVAVELPIWLSPGELDFFRSLFGCDEPLTGHIDILRVEDGKIWVWDYKPNADKEKHADCQVLFYALMLSKRTGISLDNFRCGYFDEKSAYVFKPKLSQIPISCDLTAQK